MLKRPNKDETEEDLLKYQETFLRNQSASSVKVVKQSESQSAQRDVVQLFSTPPDHSAQGDISGPSTFPIRESKFVAGKRKNKNEDNIDPDRRLDDYDKKHHFTTAFTDAIKEKDTTSIPIKLPNQSNQAFPSVLHRHTRTFANERKPSSDAKAGGSLFARQFMASTTKAVGVDDDTIKVTVVASSKTDTPIAAISKLITGEGLQSNEAIDVQAEVKRIHEDNLHKMSAMTKDDILAEQSKLMTSMDPKLVELLKKRPNKNITTNRTVVVESMDIDNKSKNDDTCHDMDVELDNEEHLHIHDNCVHTERVEKEKLQWMLAQTKDKVKGTLEDGESARFGFEGELIARDSNVPMHVGLHHHGLEPDAAGYTIEELFILTRSSLAQQKVIGLTTLAHIFDKDHRDEYRGKSEPIIPNLLDAGVLFLLRWSFDDNTLAVISSSLHAIRALVVKEEDEHCLDRISSFYRGYEVPAFEPAVGITDLKENEKSQITDADLVYNDVISGLVRMDFLPRARYVLSTCQIGANEVISCLQILWKIGRHSLQLADNVLREPGLMKCIIDNFLPMSWKELESDDSVSQLHGYPLWEAMKLVRILCTAGRNITSTLVTQFDLIARIVRFVATSPTFLQLPSERACKLFKESLKTWTVCLQYGIASNSFDDYFSIIMDKVQSLYRVTLFPCQLVNSSQIDQLLLSELLRLVEKFVRLASLKVDQTKTLERNVSQSTIEWNKVIGVVDVISDCAKKWLTEFYKTTEDTVTEEALSLLTSSLQVISSFIEGLKRQMTQNKNVIENLEEMESFVNNFLCKISESRLFSSLLQSLRNLSYNYNSSDHQMKEIASLPRFLHAYPCNHPCVTCGCFCDLYSTLLRLALSIINFHRGLARKFKWLCLRPEILEFMIALSRYDRTKSGISGYLNRPRIHLNYYLVKLYNVIASTDDSDLTVHREIYQKTVLFILSEALRGDEHIVFDLASNHLIESRGFLVGNVRYDTDTLSHLFAKTLTSTDASESLTCPSNFTKTIDDAISHLQSIRGLIIQYFRKDSATLQKSINLLNSNAFEIDSLIITYPHATITPIDWMFLPLIDLYNASLNDDAVQDGENYATVRATSDAEGVVVNTLRLIFLLEIWYPSYMASIDITAKIARLSCTFLIGSDLFFQQTIHLYLEVLLRISVQSNQLSSINFMAPIPGITSYYDLYVSLLTQYDAVSFGDYLFATFILLPLQQHCDRRLRHLVWGEYVGIIRHLCLPLNKLLFDLELYLTPNETDVILVKKYLRALTQKSLRPAWSPILYVVAVHHVSHFIFEGGEDNLSTREYMIKEICQHEGEVWAADIFRYVKPLEGNDRSLLINTCIPPEREKLIKQACLST
ncbi:RNA polymerase II-associated protein 1 [Trichoplax sp. H2]|nr:RNA polymerase II-associated protein 1 [Trichoplax sp. H2]|eukprot:RDD44932.1 RNA polymerase II-associated protein 1 [Trichoplax sp. H2]